MKSSATLKRILALFGSMALSGIFLPSLRADSVTSDQQIETEIQALKARIDALVQAQQQAEDKAAAASKSQARVSIGDSGLVISGPDGSSYLHLGALVQIDSREFLQDGGGVLNNGIFVRRARLVFDGKLDGIYSFQLTPEFGNGSAGTASAFTLLDANFTIAPSKAFGIKVGKFKVPVGLDELAADQNTLFVERSFATDLEPNRDLGAELVGTVAGDTLSYALGILNGTPDNLSASGNSDYDNDKDVVARVFVTPFLTTPDSPLQGLGFGLAGTFGRQKTHAGVTGGYKTDGQQTFFSYASAVYADGDTSRISPQAYYYVGPFGMIAEAVESTLNARPSAPTATSVPARVRVENKAGAVSLSYVLTGEDALYTGVAPARPFNWSGHSWGAVQAVARWERLEIDPDAFAGTSPLASAATNANGATALGAGLNWYLTKAVRISQDFFDTRFSVESRTAATPQILQHNEKALTTRVQLSF